MYLTHGIGRIVLTSCAGMAIMGLAALITDRHMAPDARQKMFFIIFILSWTMPWHRLARFHCPDCGMSCTFSGKWHEGPETLLPYPAFQCQSCAARWVINPYAAQGVSKA